MEKPSYSMFIAWLESFLHYISNLGKPYWSYFPLHEIALSRSFSFSFFLAILLQNQIDALMGIKLSMKKFTDKNATTKRIAQNQTPPYYVVFGVALLSVNFLQVRFLFLAIFKFLNFIDIFSAEHMARVQRGKLKSNVKKRHMQQFCLEQLFLSFKLW